MTLLGTAIPGASLLAPGVQFSSELRILTPQPTAPRS